MSIQTKKSDTHEERFFHFKIYDSKNVVHAATVFARCEPDGWFASAAFCSTKDAFCRKTGRTVARRRFFQGGSTSKLDKPLWEHAAVFLEDEAIRTLKHPIRIFT